MTNRPVQPVPHDPLAALAARLRDAGMLLLLSDADGRLVPDRPGLDDPLSRSLGASRAVQRFVAASAADWAGQVEPPPSEALPGLWVAPLPIHTRRRRTGYALVVIVTPEALESSGLHALTDGAEGADDQVCAALAILPPVPASEVGRMATIARVLHDDQERLSADCEAIENIGQQLAESYEEINLLYTITKGITEVDRPERFVALACRELLDTLPYAWIGTQLADDPRRLKRLSRQFIVAGDPGQPHEQLQSLALDVLEQVDSSEPMVFEPGLKQDHSYLISMGRTVLVCPIMRDELVIGLLIAGDKKGADHSVSSTDVKLIGATASHLGIFLENAALYEDLNTMFLGTLEALTSAIDAKDRYTCGHSQRVALLTKMLARAVGMDGYTIDRMHIAGLVHDVGKIGVPEIVLTKPGRLTDEEFNLIKKHPEIGHRILKDIPQLGDILPGVLHHHEAWNGRGYPKGLQGEEIPLVARLIALADSFDAMSSTRTYRSAMSREEVHREITRCTGTQFDPELAPIFNNLDFAEYDRLVMRQHERDLREGRFGGRAA